MGQERLIKSVMAHSLDWCETEERQIDRVAAIGICLKYSKRIEVGDAMLRVDALDAPALRKVVAFVVRRLNRNFKISRVFAERMAIAVLHELLRTNCIHCGGKGVVYRKGATSIQCAHCDGTGLHRYSDRDRESLIGGKYNTKAYEDALNYLRDSLGQIVASSARRLAE